LIDVDIGNLDFYDGKDPFHDLLDWKRGENRSLYPIELSFHNIKEIKKYQPSSLAGRFFKSIAIAEYNRRYAAIKNWASTAPFLVLAAIPFIGMLMYSAITGQGHVGYLFLSLLIFLIPLGVVLARISLFSCIFTMDALGRFFLFAGLSGDVSVCGGNNCFFLWYQAMEYKPQA